MEIYLLRHGDAEETTLEVQDQDRRLTPRGAEQVRDVLTRARLAGLAPSLIVCSPLRRAVETAQIAADILRYGGPIVEAPALAPNSTPERVWDEIQAHRDAGRLLLAGHEPLYSSVYAFLLNAPSLRVAVRKGSLGRIDIDTFSRPHGVLRWLIPPAANE